MLAYSDLTSCQIPPNGLLIDSDKCFLDRQDRAVFKGIFRVFTLSQYRHDHVAQILRFPRSPTAVGCVRRRTRPGLFVGWCGARRCNLAHCSAVHLLLSSAARVRQHCTALQALHHARGPSTSQRRPTSRPVHARATVYSTTRIPLNLRTLPEKSKQFKKEIRFSFFFIIQS